MQLEFKAADSLAEIGPGDVVVSNSDSLGMAILLENNIDLMHERPGFNSADALFETATHYAMVRYTYGHADPSENGYVSTLLPKSNFSRQDAAAFFEEAIRETLDPRKPTEWRERDRTTAECA